MERSRSAELRWIALALGSLFLFPFPSYGQTAFHSPQQSKGTAPTVAEASKFADEAEKRLFDLQVKASRASWVQENFITDDTEQVAADANEALDAAATELAGKARRFDGLKLPEGVARKLKLLKLSSIFPAPRNPADQKELARLAASLDGDYGKGVWCPEGEKGKCLDVTAIERLMATNRDPEQLKRAWLGWHAIGAPMRKRFERFVELGNKGSREMGFPDAGALWRSKYDMPPDAFAKEVDRLWEQVRPLYLSLHAYVRAQLAKKYGKDLVPESGPIPAHLLGNIWSQEWTNVYPLLAPTESGSRYDLAEILRARKTEPRAVVRYGERFFTSLGFDALPATFWKRAPTINMALQKVSFLPFGLLVDKWRWGVFSGEIKPGDYNKSWWELRLKYQGIAPPGARSETDFDPGAKYHVPANVPYMRYFLADILQFQFHRALCRTAGVTGPLHRCSIYGNKAAGEKLAKMLEMGMSRPWPEALETLTGEKQMDAGAILEYFAPLQAWLDEQNKANRIGW